MGTSFFCRAGIGACIWAMCLSLAFPVAEAAEDPIRSANWADSGVTKVGIMLPGGSSGDCFIKAGKSLMQAFEAKGYPASIYFDEEPWLKQPFQAQQIANMLADGCDVILVGALSGYDMESRIHEAHANDVRVIGFGSMLMNPEDESCLQLFEERRASEAQRTQNHAGVDPGMVADPGCLDLFSGVLDGTEYDEEIMNALSVVSPYMERGAVLMHDESLRFRRGLKEYDPVIDTSELIARCR